MSDGVIERSGGIVVVMFGPADNCTELAMSASSCAKVGRAPNFAALAVGLPAPAVPEVAPTTTKIAARTQKSAPAKVRPHSHRSHVPLRHSITPVGPPTDRKA